MNITSANQTQIAAFQNISAQASALASPNLPTHNTNNSANSNANNSTVQISSEAQQRYAAEQTLQSGGWKSEKPRIAPDAELSSSGWQSEKPKVAPDAELQSGGWHSGKPK